tara:strand:- start:230 stop:382 length:153 start_codon:yes stop_codon:yes gene_type:complete
MEIMGTPPSTDNLKELGLKDISKVHWNLSPSKLTEISIEKRMGRKEILAL